MKLKGLTEVECHIYSDKKYFEKYLESFINTEFMITQEKKSFIWEQGNIINRISERLILKKLQEIDSNDYIDAIEKLQKQYFMEMI